MPLALLAALVLHLLLLLTVSFELPAPRLRAPPDEALEVLLLEDGTATSRTPVPDAPLSQHDRAGESPPGQGTIATPVDQAPRPAAPSTSDDTPASIPGQAASGRQSTPPAPTPERPIAPPRPPREKAPEPPQPPPQPVAEPAKSVDATRILASRDQEINRLTASLQARSNAYASRPRHRTISASTREFRYANYLSAWARKVERIGNLNYPQAANRQKLYGNLILDVAVRADGRVEQVRVVRSSGHPLLDEAAIKIVHLAAPYAPFPPDIAAETDILNILRTWQFMRGGTLGWEDQGVD